MRVLWACWLLGMAAVRAVAGNGGQPHATDGNLSLMAPGNYPRTLTRPRMVDWLTSTGTTLPNGTAVLQVFAGLPGAGAWQLRGVVAQDARSGIDLANCFLVQEPVSGRLLAAYRHHFNCTGAACRRYTLQLAASEDGGATWAPTATMIQASSGLWEPFLLVNDSCLLSFFARELAPPTVILRAQDIALLTSCDGGQSWSAAHSIVHTSASRLGMPGMTVLPDKSWLLVFERTTRWTEFSVEYVRSVDSGRTWLERGVVYAPRRRNAGAPQVAWARNQIYVSFMTNDDDADPPPWVQGAFTKVSITPCSVQACTLAFPPRPQVVVAPASSFWPAVFATSNGTAVYAETGWQDATYLSGPL